MPAVPGAHEAAATARFRQDLSARSPSFYLGLSMDTIAPLWLWLTFVACVLAALFVDFVVLRKQGAHEVSVKEALNWSLVWVLMIGIVGAIVLRTLMILVGSWLIAQFHWILYVFGAFLLITGIKMWWAAGQEPDMENNPALRLLRRLMPVSRQLDGEKFFTVENGRRIATPLLLVIALVGLTDVIDSIPAIFAITTDPFIVLTSNIFAILGLRAMYFLLAAVATKFHLLSYGLAVILAFIGTKMMLIDVVKIPVLASLGVVVAILAITMVWSLRTAPRLPTPAGDGCGFLG